MKYLPGKLNKFALNLSQFFTPKIFLVNLFYNEVSPHFEGKVTV